MERSVILQCTSLSKSFKTPADSLVVLEDINFILFEGETCAVLGPSGSGKTTLLTLAAGLDLPTSGTVTCNGSVLTSMTENERALFRREAVGFVFQSYRLMTSLTALENVSLPIDIQGRNGTREALELLDRVGLAHRVRHYPSELSGGEQQRVALARAFVNRPAILFADEPTGSLDRENAETAMDIMIELNREYGSTLLLVTHDQTLGSRMQRQIDLQNGRLV